MRALTIVFLTLLSVACFAGGAFVGYDYIQLRQRVETIEEVNRILSADYLNRKMGINIELFPPSGECPKAPCQAPSVMGL